MPDVILSPLPKQFFLDNNGKPMSNGQLFVYEAGTTTKTTTYVDAGGVATNTNPIRLDFRGECDLWLVPNTGYKFVLAPANDTDPPTNPIWTVDDVIDDQLLTLYGGVDTGSTNAYILNYDANFSSYTDGIVIYWVPSNTNTGASTVNVNGLGPVPIENQDGSPLRPRQLVSGNIAQMMFTSTSFVLLSSFPYSGTFTGTLTGVSGTVTGTVQWSISGDLASITIPSTLSGTSNAPTCTISGMPSYLTPVTTKIVSMPAYSFRDNGTISPGSVNVLMASVSSEIQFTYAGVTNGFTASGTKGVYATLTIVYPLT